MTTNVGGKITDWGGEAPGRRTRPKAEAKGGVRGGGSPPAKTTTVTVTTVTVTTTVTPKSWVKNMFSAENERGEGITG